MAYIVNDKGMLELEFKTSEVPKVVHPYYNTQAMVQGVDITSESVSKAQLHLDHELLLTDASGNTNSKLKNWLSLVKMAPSTDNRINQKIHRKTRFQKPKILLLIAQYNKSH